MPREERIERVAVLLVFSTCSSCGLHSSCSGCSSRLVLLSRTRLGTSHTLTHPDWCSTASLELGSDMDMVVMWAGGEERYG